MKKICTKCKQEKAVEEFWVNNLMKDGRYQHCKPCGKVKNNAWRDKHFIKEYKPDERFTYNGMPYKKVVGLTRKPKKVGTLPQNGW